MLYAFVIFPVLRTSPVQLIVLNLNILILQFSQLYITWLILSPNILLSILFSNAPFTRETKCHIRANNTQNNSFVFQSLHVQIVRTTTGLLYILLYSVYHIYISDSNANHYLFQ
jgi:hypothetical protein